MATTSSDGSSTDVESSEPRFDPRNYLLRIRMEDEEDILEVGGAPEEFVRSYSGKLYHLSPGREEDFQPDEKQRIASVEFQVIGLTAYLNGGFGTAFSCLDELSQDLCEVGDALFDAEDDVEGERTREELDFALPVGDLLYIELIEVAPTLRSDQVFEIVRYLLENLLVRFAHGCFAAVYYHANWESIGLARPLRDRGFSQVPGNRNIWFADLGKERPQIKGK
jgi:hypothetical protein